MIRVERAALPEGLRAIAYRDHNGNLVVCVAEELDSGSQRAAVIDAIRAARRVGWRAGLPPAGIALFLGARALLRRAARQLKARPAAWGTATAATVTAAAVSAYFLAAPQHPGSPSAGQQPGPSVVAPASPHRRQPARPGGHPGTSGRAGSTGRSGAVSPVSARVKPGAPTGPGTPLPTAPAPGPSPTPTSAPQPTPQPTPTPSPSPSPGSGLCIHLLGTKICLRL